MRAQALLTGLALVITIPLTSPAPPAHAAADGCAPGVQSDFNGDGWSDAVVADPMATVSGVVEAGRIVVLYGDGDGRVGEGLRDELHQNSPGVGGGAEPGDHFGAALATADLDCDGYTDVVVGVPGEDIGGLADVGWVQVVHGGAGGLGTSSPGVHYSQSSFGAVAAAGDEFGYAVDAVEDLGQGGTPDP
ncbi:MAG: VCBS repeat-containing protein, partial [Propionibacteriaceae bacterium]|nr:VCBS repeat-containing protein [Propionibacteriaceae bacterium]